VSAAATVTATASTDRSVLERAIRFNLIVVSITMGFVLGAVLWLATAILLVRGGTHVGLHLGLLGVFLPFYSVSWPGAFIGAFWGFVGGAVSGAILYGAYARSLRRGITTGLLESGERTGIRLPVMLMSGPALGLGLGTLGALQLFLATNWLVVRGTAAYSENAALLGQYLPGYTVSFAGSLIGGAQVFAIAFIVSLFVAAVYNKIARGRAQR